jgi:hypothetical protein
MSKKYQVIIINDDVRNKDYYQGYVESEDTALGNITVEELPPYADPNMARACWWDSENRKWVFDEDKEAEIQEKIKSDKEAAEKAQAEAEATPSNSDLAGCVIELGELISDLLERVTKLEGSEA